MSNVISNKPLCLNNQKRSLKFKMPIIGHFDHVAYYGNLRVCFKMTTRTTTARNARLSVRFFLDI